MVWVVRVLGVLAVLVGAVWFGQGAGWIRGSFMTGRHLYLALGIVLALVGVLLVAGSVAVGRRRSSALR